MGRRVYPRPPARSRRAAGFAPCGYTARPVLSFKVGPFPVTVYPWFFISAVLLGGGIGFGWQLLVWVFVVFVSVLAHELGHALVGKLYGGKPEIRLEAFGGVTYSQLPGRPSPAKQFILSLAG